MNTHLYLRVFEVTIVILAGLLEIIDWHLSHNIANGFSRVLKIMILGSVAVNLFPIIVLVVDILQPFPLTPQEMIKTTLMSSFVLTLPSVILVALLGRGHALNMAVSLFILLFLWCSILALWSYLTLSTRFTVGI